MYDLIVIVRPSEVEDTAKQQLTKLLTDDGIEILATNVWGKKTLAYPIQKHTDGIYFHFELGGVVAEKHLQGLFKLNDSIIRTLLVKSTKSKKKQAVAS